MVVKSLPENDIRYISYSTRLSIYLGSPQPKKLQETKTRSAYLKVVKGKSSILNAALK